MQVFQINHRWCVYKYMHACIYVNMCVHIYLYMYIYACMSHICLSIHTHNIYTHTYIQTHTHTYTYIKGERERELFHIYSFSVKKMVLIINHLLCHHSKFLCRDVSNAFNNAAAIPTQKLFLCFWFSTLCTPTLSVCTPKSGRSGYSSLHLKPWLMWSVTEIRKGSALEN